VAAKKAKASCGTEFASETQWRQAFTHANSQGEYSATSDKREKLLEKRRAYMEKYIFDKTDTPEMEFVSEEGVKVTVIRENISPQGHDQTAQIKVGGIGAAGILKGSLLLPVSGHCGIASAKQWSKTDLYDVQAWDENDRKTGMLATGAKSLDLITIHEVELPLVKGKFVKMAYYRGGSGGPGGYYTGRVIEVMWDGT
jgi:hypothetical protein